MSSMVTGGIIAGVRDIEPIRSVLFVPAVRPRFIEKAPEVGADAICIDLEDSVAPGDKVTAREGLRAVLPAMPRTGYRLLVRVNGIDTGLLEEELQVVVGPHLDGISLPKAHTPGLIRQVDAYLTLLEKTRGLPAGQVRILPWIESALGVVNALEVLGASERVTAAQFGAEDFTADMMIQRTRGSEEFAWARAATAVACRAAGVWALDTPQPDFRDMEHLREDARYARSIGYGGKYCIHPDQVAVVNEVFGPTPAEIEWAHRVIEVYREGEARGVGAVSLDGEMIDRPIVVRAERLLEWAARGR